MEELGDESMADELAQDQFDNDMTDNQEMDGINNEEPVEGDAEENDESEINNDDTASIINKLTPDQREAVRSYAESFLKDEESSENMSEESNISESFIFTKKQLQELNERLGDNHSTDDKQNFAKKEKKIKMKSPFNSPTFN